MCTLGEESLTLLDGTRTPPELFRLLNAKYHFVLDLFAQKGNELVDRYCDAKIDALSVEWVNLTVGWCFANPPYSRGKLALFVMKAIEEAKKGAGIIAVIPCTTGVQWFNDRILRPCDTLEGFTVDHPGVVYPSGAPVLAGYCLSMQGIGYRQKVTFLKGRVPFLPPLDWPVEKPWNPPSFDSVIVEWRPPLR